MPLEKLPVPDISLSTQDVGSVFQGKMNAAIEAVRAAIVAFNNQIDAAQTASQQVEPAPFEIAVAGENNSYKMTPLRVKQVIDTQLGTASKLTATTSQVDRTGGRALRVGDHGFGEVFRARVDVLAASTPAQIVAEHGEGYSYGGTIQFHGTAAPTTYGVLSGYITSGNGYSYSYQAFSDLYGGQWTRTAQAGGAAWNPWTIQYAGNNVVGPVGFAGGVSTGSVIERGSNSNGNFIALADGTLICWHSFSANYTMQAYSSGLYIAGPNWTFPTGFVSPPVISGSGVDSQINGWLSIGAGVTTTGATLAYFTRSNSPALIVVHVLAVGRWRV